MNEIRNLISQTQNNDESRQYLAATCYFTWIVKRLAKWQLILTVLLPVALSISAIRFPWVRTWAALYGIVISVVDVSLIERKLREWKIDSAKIQECFDCKILNIAWNEIKVGGKPEREKISSASERYGQKCDNELEDWFTTEIAALPLPLARIIGQRINTWWPTAMRRKYLWWLQFIFIALCVSALVVSIAMGRGGMDALILTVLAPISPTILWFIREIRKQKETTAKLEGLMDKIEAIWDKARGGELTEEQLEEKARQFQDETYDFRCSYQPINSSVYRFLRKDFPKRMQTTVTEMVREALHTLESRSDVTLIENNPIGGSLLMRMKPRLKQGRLGEKLLQIRNTLGLSQTEMWRRLGVEDSIPQKQISKYELGVSEPPLQVVLLYARVAGVNMEALVDDKLDLPERLPDTANHRQIERRYAPRRKRK